MKRREFLATAACAGLFPLFCAPSVRAESAGATRWHERMQPMMGTFVSVAVLSADREAALAAAGGAFDAMRRAAFELSHWDVSSPVSLLSRNRNIKAAELPSAVARLFDAAAAVERFAGGRFKLLSNALTGAWRAAKDAGAILDANDIRRLRRSIESSAFVRREGGIVLGGDSGIDSGGIGKGLVADIGAEYLARQGVSYARVACSGDIRFVGSRPWDVSLEDPRGEFPLRTVRLPGNAAIATSGDYRACWFVNGRRYHHLIDPRTGLPGTVNQQATAMASSGVLADALASALFFMHADEARAFLRNFPGASGVLVDSRHRVTLIG